MSPEDKQTAIDDIYNLVESSTATQLDLIIELVNPKADTDILLAWLTATLPIRLQLSSRQKLIDIVTAREGSEMVKGL
jgi:hypothetical protein